MHCHHILLLLLLRYLNLLLLLQELGRTRVNQVRVLAQIVARLTRVEVLRVLLRLVLAKHTTIKALGARMKLFEGRFASHIAVAWEARFGPDFFLDVLIILVVRSAGQIACRGVLLLLALIVARVQVDVLVSLAPMPVMGLGCSGAGPVRDHFADN